MCSWRDSNLSTLDLESDALPIEPPHHPIPVVILSISKYQSLHTRMATAVVTVSEVMEDYRLTKIMLRMRPRATSLLLVLTLTELGQRGMTLTGCVCVPCLLTHLYQTLKMHLHSSHRGSGGGGVGGVASSVVRLSNISVGILYFFLSAFLHRRG